jgi:hypothetical protein
MTLGAAAAASVRLIVWCRGCGHQVEPDPGEMAARYGAETPVLDWRERLVCSGCAELGVDYVVMEDQAASPLCGGRASRRAVLVSYGICWAA